MKGKKRSLFVRTLSGETQDGLQYHTHYILTSASPAVIGNNSNTPIAAADKNHKEQQNAAAS